MEQLISNKTLQAETSTSEASRRLSYWRHGLKKSVRFANGLSTVSLSMAGAILALLVIDRLSKLWVLSTMEIGSSLHVIPDLVKFSFYVNRGAVSGFGQHLPYMATLLAVIGVVFIPCILVFYHLYTKHQGESFWIRAFLVTGLSAMISTIVDRLHYGYVIDFIAVRSLPIFNFADILPPIGGFALLVEVVSNIRRTIRSTE